MSVSFLQHEVKGEGFNVKTTKEWLKDVQNDIILMFVVTDGNIKRKITQSYQKRYFRYSSRRVYYGKIRRCSSLIYLKPSRDILYNTTILFHSLINGDRYFDCRKKNKLSQIYALCIV